MNSSVILQSRAFPNSGPFRKRLFLATGLFVPASGLAGLGDSQGGSRALPRPHPRPWHGGSIFGPGPRRRLDRNQRARFRFLLNAHKWAGRLADKTDDVGAALLKRLSGVGRCDPSQATLADVAGCEERTVRRAITSMRDLGLLRWERRLVRNGWRCEQTSNAYELVPTAHHLQVPHCGGQNVRETGFLDESRKPNSAVVAAPDDVAAALAALARRRAVVEARLALNGSGHVVRAS